MSQELILKLKKVEKIASYSKIRRCLHQPFHYFHALFFRKCTYPIFKKEKEVDANLFFDKKMRIALPAATDIFLTGGKSHDSEIRLAKFLILNLKSSSHFLDIGAHFGYFTLLANEVIGNSGKIVAFEPSENSYKILQQNTVNKSKIQIFHKAISNNLNPIVFYEFSNLYSEFNTSDVDQFENEIWFKDAISKTHQVQTNTIDTLIDAQFQPDFIKIDVEGAELNVINGGEKYFKNYAPVIIMEFLSKSRKNKNHKEAAAVLKKANFKTFIILSDGKLKEIQDIENYFEEKNIESDNIVFQKTIN